MMIHIIVSGFVQGVGFRKFIRYEARKLNLTGFVRNMPNETVEIVAFGEKENLEKLIAKAKKGSFIAEVKNVDIEWNNSENTSDEFLIKKD